MGDTEERGKEMDREMDKTRKVKKETERRKGKTKEGRVKSRKTSETNSWINMRR